MKKVLSVCLAVMFSAKLVSAEIKMPKKLKSKKPNIVFFLTDDHRFDALGFMGHPFLKTPHLDKLAAQGAHMKNAFVTTSLCSPSRASILTGKYAHSHGVIDNYNDVDPTLLFFPQYLQKVGYETGFIGKWHMGDSNEPQRGFDHWAAFRGQGTYYADGHGASRVVPQNNYDGYNVNGKKVPQLGYITDELTDMSIDWLNNRKQKEKPFFMYVSHKGVHSDFVARDEDRGIYKDKPWTPPSTYANTPENRKNKPMWLINQRNSRHGSDYGYNLENFDVTFYFKRYSEALIPIDDAVGRTIEHLRKMGELDNTLFVYMGDNGFQFGEQGLIDKRTAYEASMRVPMIMRYPKAFKGGTVVDEIVANIDIAPTILEAAGLATPEQMHGESFWKILQGKEIPWRDYLLYEYLWEWNYPQTPTIHAVRGDQYKYIRYHGVWDTDELYDLVNDPDEKNNLIKVPEHQERIAEMKNRMFAILTSTDGKSIPLKKDKGRQFFNRLKGKAEQGEFPKWYYDKMIPVTK
ncbi:mucin-desulfating sulfatase (N-acetylglucosamine-6-sulfatase) [Lentisphaera araneosa HTCC2155]|uniref:Mucin-desulfating sulfatase (N-acetylglucosamine-6-sulfatase) n=1 Tax=Lentisphaera araneosa HTCC2155 TaxID=313628 RepID=A6DMU7_9BACT|nr:sulfatase [Lentisphaera araneosa]EDM26983.1 mucin-desulfating sulfatase (N-acetylglucosamine-6-sulfatase) [Lentisphaera araneosa HTCC2155]